MLSKLLQNFVQPIKQKRVMLIGTVSLISFLSIWIRTKDLLLVGSLWYDEAMLADNIISRNFLNLCKPLDWFQVAPIGYLWIVKFFALVSGYSDIGFRFISYIIGISIPPLFFIISYKMSRDIIVSFTISIAVCFNWTLIYYSTELKPYIIDVFLGLFIILLYEFKNMHFIQKNYYILFSSFFILGGFFFSYYFVLSASLVIYLSIFGSWPFKTKLYTVGFAVLATGLSYVIIAYNHPYTEFMNTYWQNDFIDISSGIITAFKTLYWKFLIVLRSYYNFNPPEVSFFIILILSLIVAFKRPKLLVWLAMPVIIHILLAFAGKYPLTPRLHMLWLTNLFFLFVAAISQIKNAPVKYCILSIVLVQIVPWKSIPDLFYKQPATKCYSMKHLSEIPDNSTAYISESIVPLYNVESKRGTFPRCKNLTIIKGTGLINSKKKTSQAFGLKVNPTNTAVKDISKIDAQPLYILIHKQSNSDIEALVKDLKFFGNINTIRCQKVMKSTYNLFDAALLKN